LYGKQGFGGNKVLDKKYDFEENKCKNRRGKCILEK